MQGRRVYLKYNPKLSELKWFTDKDCTEETIRQPGDYWFYKSCWAAMLPTNQQIGLSTSWVKENEDGTITTKNFTASEWSGQIVKGEWIVKEPPPLKKVAKKEGTEATVGEERLIGER